MVTVMNSVDTGHKDMIHDAQLDYYGIRLATCSTDKSVKIFDVQSGNYKLVVELIEHEGPVWQLAWAHPTYGTILASCGYDKKVIIWKETNGEWGKFHEYNSFDSSVNSVCWAPYEYGLILAAASSDRSISILTLMGDGSWDAKKILDAHLISCNAVSWGSSIQSNSLLDHSQTAQSLAPKRFVSGGADTLVIIWREDNEGWVKEKQLEYHSDWVRDVAWAPSIGLPGDIIASCSQDRKVIIWSNNGTSNEWLPLLLHEFSDVVWHLSWSVTGNILAVSGGDNKVSMWKRNQDDKWICISNFDKGQAQLNKTESSISN